MLDSQAGKKNTFLSFLFFSILLLTLIHIVMCPHNITGLLHEKCRKFIKLQLTYLPNHLLFASGLLLIAL